VGSSEGGSIDVGELQRLEVSDLAKSDDNYQIATEGRMASLRMKL
jgi:hypothetical protein